MRQYSRKKEKNVSVGRYLIAITANADFIQISIVGSEEPLSSKGI